MKIMADLCVKSIEDSVAFYRDVLGFAVEMEVPGPDGKLAHANMGFGSSSIMFDRLEWLSADQQEHLGRGFCIYVELDDDFEIDAYYERIVTHGTTITSEIQDQFWGARHFGVADPDGYSISFAKQVTVTNSEEIQQVLAGAS